MGERNGNQTSEIQQLSSNCHHEGSRAHIMGPQTAEVCDLYVKNVVSKSTET